MMNRSPLLDLGNRYSFATPNKQPWAVPRPSPQQASGGGGMMPNRPQMPMAGQMGGGYGATGQGMPNRPQMMPPPMGAMPGQQQMMQSGQGMPQGQPPATPWGQMFGPMGQPGQSGQPGQPNWLSALLEQVRARRGPGSGQVPPVA